jgi:superfamily I DNA and/or RNA helicase
LYFLIRSFESANNFLLRIILNSDESLYKYKKYLEVLSKISSLLINGYILTKYNANFSEYILNFIFMETKSFLKISENKKKLILYLLLNYGLPLIIELMKTLYNYFIPGYQVYKIRI